jgi:uncharacterized membrane protein
LGRFRLAWISGAVLCWLGGFATIVYVCGEAIVTGGSVWAWDFLVGVGAHAVLAVAALWMYQRARPYEEPPAEAGEEPVRESGGGVDVSEYTTKDKGE